MFDHRREHVVHRTSHREIHLGHPRRQYFCRIGGPFLTAAPGQGGHGQRIEIGEYQAGRSQGSVFVRNSIFLVTTLAALEHFLHGLLHVAAIFGRRGDRESIFGQIFVVGLKLVRVGPDTSFRARFRVGATLGKQLPKSRRQASNLFGGQDHRSHITGFGGLVDFLRRRADFLHQGDPVTNRPGRQTGQIRLGTCFRRCQQPDQN